MDDTGPAVRHPAIRRGALRVRVRSVVGCVAAPDVLDKIKEDNEFIRADVLKFVSQCQYYPGEDMGIVKRGTLVPLPRKA
uniref:Uncharacterized protein n=1 Tax=Bombyx mori TaxID=7091 RepID=A0A8R2R5W6_BOMMO|nr:uncharacterized protein LOC105842652 [Bombyx mori]